MHRLLVICLVFFSQAAIAENQLSLDCLGNYSNLLKPVPVSNIQTSKFSKLTQPMQYIGRLPAACESFLGFGEINIISTNKGLYSVDVRLLNRSPTLIKYIAEPERTQIQVGLDRNNRASSWFNGLNNFTFVYEVVKDKGVYIEELKYRGREASLYE